MHFETGHFGTRKCRLQIDGRIFAQKIFRHETRETSSIYLCIRIFDHERNTKYRRFKNGIDSGAHPEFTSKIPALRVVIYVHIYTDVGRTNLNIDTCKCNVKPRIVCGEAAFRYISAESYLEI